MTQSELFDGLRSERLKQDGMASASSKSEELLGHARTFARRYATVHGQVTADDVGRYMKAEHGIETLGPAAGSIFKGKGWRFTGEYVKSKRITNHSRLLRVWTTA